MKCDCKIVFRIELGSIFVVTFELTLFCLKNLFIAAALMALSILPVNAKAANFKMDENKPRIIITEEREKNPTRSPIDYDVDMTVESVNNTLSIYFKTDSTGWSFLNISGMMPGSSVYKHLLGVTLYGAINTNSITEEECDEQGEKDV